MDKDHEHSLLLTRHIKPDYGFYVLGDDRLYVAAYSSVASLVVRFSGYFLDSRGEVNQYAVDVAPTSDRAVTSALQFLGEGFVLSCTAHLATGNANRGQCYVRARIQRGTGATLVPVVQLLGGYLTDDFSPTFPYGKIEGPLEGPGMIRSITGSNPAAGVEVSETVPTGARWQLRVVRVRFVTDGNAATRVVVLTLDDGIALFAMSSALGGHTAGAIWDYVFGAYGTEDGTTAAAIVNLLPLPLPMMAGGRIQTATIALQAGDDFGAPQLLVEEWIEA